MRMPGMFTLEKTRVQETQNEERDGKRGGNIFKSKL